MEEIEEFKLSPEDQQDLDQHYAERNMLRDDLEGFVALKKPKVKECCETGIQKFQDYASPSDVKSLDFNKSLGDTIKEKFESLMFDCIQIGRELKHSNCHMLCDPYWVCGSPELVSIFETSRCFDPTGFEYNNALNYVGNIPVLEDRWHILKKPSMKADQFYVGCGNICVQINIDNFII